jgi:hypothetical protein
MEGLIQQDSQLEVEIGDEYLSNHDATNIVESCILAMGIYDFSLRVNWLHELDYALSKKEAIFRYLSTKH